jgi:hypothetical protein
MRGSVVSLDHFQDIQVQLTIENERRNKEILSTTRSH